MPTDSTGSLAARRILRLALGTALSLWFSQAFPWMLSFIAPIFTLLLLGLPLPPPGPRKGVAFVLVLVLPILVGSALLLPFLTWLRPAGVLLAALALFHTFWFTARGGSPLLGQLLTVGLAIVLAVGSVSLDLVPAITLGVAQGAVVGLLFVWIAHALLPDPPADPALAARQPPAPAPVAPETARRNALRALVVVLPVAVWILFSPDSLGYLVVMIKVSTMGQQASATHSRDMGRDLLESTFWGGLGAIVGWQLLSLWPSLTFYTLLIALAGLLYGRGMFRGAGLHPRAPVWSYAFLTLLVLLAPAVMDVLGGSDAGTAFWTRLWLIAIVALYGTLAVAAFDAFWPARTQSAAGQPREA